MNQRSLSPPPSYASVVNELREEYQHNFDELIRRFNISPIFAEKLNKLKGYEIVFICDDSGSMKAPLGDVTNPLGPQKTRWDELKETVSIVVDLASVFDPDGIDVYFLNRESMVNVRKSSELENIFAVEPEGSTPIVPVLRQVLREKRNQIYERKLLIIIATDGVPTDERERPDSHTLEHVLKNERRPIDRIPVTIVACTDDDTCMEYLNDWDEKIPNLDVIDDYESEKKEIQKCQGKDFPFGFGDYIVKILMGGIDSWIDNLDERKVTVDNQTQSNRMTYNFSQGASPSNYR
ncbi:unnamed protein product [Adineta steineri]|uniref:VWFA domain-containing protein n=1 Tax=Adineta steineri TaxID=433720 RepID=A0A815J1H0_9BILA|nr:unnamed protein product [Adineta steineri]CAF3878651.1 unnamed protein product [Adineta steineri]